MEPKVPRYVMNRYVTTIKPLTKLVEKEKVVWNEMPSDYIRSSNIIHGILMGAILPAPYVIEDEQGRYKFVSKSAIFEDLVGFYRGEWCLDFGNTAAPLHGLSFNDLPPVLQNRIEDAEFVFVVIPNNPIVIESLKEIMNA